VLVGLGLGAVGGLGYLVSRRWHVCAPSEYLARTGVGSAVYTLHVVTACDALKHITLVMRSHISRLTGSCNCTFFRSACAHRKKSRVSMNAPTPFVSSAWHQEHERGTARAAVAVSDSDEGVDAPALVHV
jgi:hypothetical protein